MKPLISIGMPVFNGEPFISEAIQSLLAQSEPRFELIISDNKSTDKTIEICNEYLKKDGRIKVIIQDKNRGALYNFRQVLEKANGKFFLWAAADDKWSNNWLEKLLESHNDNTSVTFGIVQNITNEGIPFKTYKINNLKTKSIFSQIVYYLQEDTYGKANIIYGMYKTKLIKRIGLNVLGKVSYADDMLFVFNFLQYGDIYFNHSAIIYKRLPIYKQPDISFYKIINRIIIIDRIKTYFFYFKISNNLYFKFSFFILLPVKYILSLIYNFKLLFSSFTKILRISISKKF